PPSRGHVERRRSALHPDTREPRRPLPRKHPAGRHWTARRASMHGSTASALRAGGEITRRRRTTFWLSRCATTWAARANTTSWRMGLDERWTLLVVRELGSGSKGFKEILRGGRRISPTLRSKRLQESPAASPRPAARPHGGDIRDGAGDRVRNRC